ncbi:MAG: YdcF family protein [Bacteroidia bacterium]|nr:YdcF family protein [Bacteroidia bacterium]
MKFLKFFRGVLILLAIVTGLVLIGIIFKVQIATFMGNYLIHEDNNTKVDAAFVLAGLPTERLPYAKKLYDEGLFPVVVTTGEHIDSDLKVLEMPWSDAKVGKIVLTRMGIDSSNIVMLEQGLNTFEESEEILGFAQARGYKRIMVVSSKFHTRRIKNVFKKKFANEGIEVVIKGAPALEYSIDQWWLSKHGLTFVLNEYIKLVYYKFTY